VVSVFSRNNNLRPGAKNTNNMRPVRRHLSMAKEGATPNNENRDKPAAGPAPTPPTEEPAEVTDWELRYKYLLADFDNFRRRTERDRAVLRSDAEGTLLRRLIPIVEGFQNAESAAKSLPSSDSLRRGLELLGHELDAVLRLVGFAPVARVGEPFRHEEHEAVGETVGPKDVPDGAVADIVQQGYRFQGGLLRPAKVLVARAVKKAEAPSVPPVEPAEENPFDPTVEEGSD
jgi:molecular chaperone GrpE